jgi:uncharacterized protein
VTHSWWFADESATYKTLQEITENGGAVLRPAEDTPYGRLAAGTDPTGTAFNLSSLQN